MACAWASGPVVERETGGFYRDGGGAAWQGPGLYRPVYGFPPTGLGYGDSRGHLYRTALHEFAHVFGIGTYWWSGTNGAPVLVNPARGGAVADTHFPGRRAVEAFDAAGGESYTGGKVPVANDNVHWHYDALCGELMSHGGGCAFGGYGRRYKALSAITLGALADLGWLVDMSVAEPYSLPDPKLAADSWDLGFDVVRRQR
ncbi:MAG: hypothetical protein OXI46_00190 [Gemmatimonadota bacterium]|nr:hypothetical protein [Gemmatimonadota bacterium]